MSKTILSVLGISCPSCVARVNEALSIRGVANIAIELDQGVIAVEHDATVSVGQLLGALSHAGYEATLRSPRDQLGHA
jgi:copper chaperone CopZ